MRYRRKARGREGEIENEREQSVRGKKNHEKESRQRAANRGMKELNKVATTGAKC